MRLAVIALRVNILFLFVDCGPVEQDHNLSFVLEFVLCVVSSEVEELFNLILDLSDFSRVRCEMSRRWILFKTCFSFSFFSRVQRKYVTAHVKRLLKQETTKRKAEEENQQPQRTRTFTGKPIDVANRIAKKRDQEKGIKTRFRRQKKSIALPLKKSE